MIRHIQAKTLALAVFFVTAHLLFISGCSCFVATPQFTENEREWTVYIDGEKQSQKERCPRIIPQAYHANRLLEGDFRTITMGELFVRPSTRPYHLNRLIEIGEDSSSILIALLESDAKTNFKYSGRPEMVFDSGLYQFEEWESQESHDMTIGDMASYALRVIHQQDFRFRSYLSDADREDAIRHWEGYWLKKSSNLASPFIELPDNPDDLQLQQ